MSFMIETSARHIHLTQETVEKLFGEGYQLTVRKPLSYPGQYACNERLTIVGPKKEMANVSILGPTRKADQVEVSATDARTLGIDAAPHMAMLPDLLVRFTDEQIVAVAEIAKAKKPGERIHLHYLVPILNEPLKAPATGAKRAPSVENFEGREYGQGGRL